MIEALIFDVDGTLAETEEAHRAAFNAVFAHEGLGWVWSVERYRDLLKTTGGKERIARFLAEEKLSLPPERIAELHRAKNDAYMQIVRGGGAPFRPGIGEIIAEARAAGLKLAICTTTSRVNIEALLDASLGAEGEETFPVRIVGEDVRAKKPDPEAYLLTLARLGLAADKCLALEDSRNGVEAAVAAGIPVVACSSFYTAHENFPGAAAVRTDWRGFDWRDLA